MQIPENKPPLLLHKEGLEDESNGLIYEKYTQYSSGRANAVKVFDNGNCYKILKGKKAEIKSDLVKWKKKGILTEQRINKIRDVLQGEAMDYIASSSQKKHDHPNSYSYHYFYEDGQHFAYTEDQRFRFTPKFVRKLEKLLEF